MTVERAFAPVNRPNSDRHARVAFCHLSDQNIFDEVANAGSRRCVGTTASPELLKLLAPVLRADILALEAYRYAAEPPLDCPISCFGGKQDSQVTRKSLDGWREQTKASFGLRLFPSGHFFIDSDRFAVLRAIADELGPWRT